MGVLKNVGKATLSAIISKSNIAPVSQGDITYYGDAAELVKPADKYGSSPSYKSSNGNPLDFWDISQSHFFTVQIYTPASEKPGYGKATGLHDRNGKPFMFASGEGTYKDYLPIKTMNFSYTSYDNMTIPLAVLGDFPLLHRKKVTTINFSCYDMDQDVIETALRYWEQQCFPGDKYVEYLDNAKATLKYTSYDVTGKWNFVRVLDVIPTGAVTVSRSYEENGAKLLNFSVMAVGYPGMSGKVSSGGLTIKERGLGDGNDNADLTYEKKVNLIYNATGTAEPTTWIYADQEG